MIPQILVVFLIGTAVAVPPEDFSSFEFMDRSTNLDEPAYRLRDTVQPTDMLVELDVDLILATFNGFVTIHVNVTEYGLSEIVLHQKVVSIETVTIVNATTNEPVPLRFPNPFTTDSYYELLKIHTDKPISSGRYIISIKYKGKINENPIDRGFYRGYYYGNSATDLRYYATTQFQPYHARKAFPCFDEPQFKSKFVISITRDSELSQSYSNMAIANTVISGNRTTETFYPTPIISAYLVAFHVSDFVETNSTSSEARPFKIISRQGVTEQHKYAADIGLKITTELDDYFAIQYHEMGQGVLMKNDHIALPDFPSGAMENWGMVNYREAYLLYDPDNTNLPNKITIATIMAHELGHKWFGNLVTCFWWSNLWLNESFASFFEYFGAHNADKSLELDDQFVVDYVHSALNWDAASGATPMNWTSVVDNDSVSAHFSTTSYAKGASVLRMLEHFVGARTFRNALRYYLRDNAYDIGTPEKLYDAFRQATSEDLSYAENYPDTDVGELFDSWVQQGGAPVVNVYVNMTSGEIHISQERFLLTNSSTPLAAQRWQIPITWTHSRNFTFNNTKPSFVLTDPVTIQNTPGHSFVILNIAQSGYYRVNYDDHNWEMIASYLRGRNMRNIHKLNRAQIVNDVLHFLRAEKINIPRAMDVISYLQFEDDYYVWAGALGQLDWLRRRFEHLPNAYAQFNAYLITLLNNAVRQLGFNERASDSTSTILNRIQVLNYACNLGHEGCVSDSLNKWRAFKANSTVLVPVNLRRHVYCLGVREGDKTDYDFLFARYNTSQNTADMVVMLRALGCTKDEAQLNHYLTQSMYNNRIRVHDKTNAFSFALQGNQGNLPIVLQFLYTNFISIRNTYGGPARLTMAINALANHLTDFTLITEFQTWAYENQVELGSSFGAAVSVIRTARSNLDWGSRLAPEVYDYILESRSDAASLTTPIILLFAALAAQLLH